MAHDVFISYSARDKPAADAICAKLESRGVRCWIAPRDIHPGSSWGAAIIEAIDHARVMLLVFSSHANSSPQITREVERSVSKGQIIIPVRIDEIKPTGDFEYFLGTPHWLDAITPPFEQHLEKIAAAAKFWLDPTAKDSAVSSKPDGWASIRPAPARNPPLPPTPAPRSFETIGRGITKSSLAKVILRSLMGLIFVVFGSNMFLHFIPNPPEPPAAMDFFTALFKTGYFIPMIGATQVVSGVLLLTGMLVPFALILIAPVIVNIFLFHVFLAPGGLPLAIIVVALELILAWMHRESFAPLLPAAARMRNRAPSAQPLAPSESPSRICNHRVARRSIGLLF